MNIDPDDPRSFSVILFLIAILLAIGLIVSCLLLLPEEETKPIIPITEKKDPE